MQMHLLQEASSAIYTGRRRWEEGSLSPWCVRRGMDAPHGSPRPPPPHTCAISVPSSLFLKILFKVAAPAALQSVRNAPRIVCAKVERGQRQRRRSATAPTEMRTCPRCEQCVNSTRRPRATSPCGGAQLCIPFLC
uniref:Metallothionein 3 n=1 Tax=Rousettus aegyptiacus TaxID=9407 RepID=A0A7J8CJG3_ROUAE|nr:metallothionein 3 [Rousettus aegyptiacus]